jgi:polyhydroxybutyrate depolymerase
MPNLARAFLSTLFVVCTGLGTGCGAHKSTTGCDAADCSSGGGGLDAGLLSDGGRDGGDGAGDGGLALDGGVDAGLSAEAQVILAARPYRTVVPSGYDGGFAVPMVVLLHGYGASGSIQDDYFGFTALANAKTFILATPDGMAETGGTQKRYWNATDACCDFFKTAPDDVKYLTAILDQTALEFRIDPKRVYFVGHSNGGFMSHRMACERSERIAAIVSLAGATWKDANRCEPTAPVSVLQVHGTADATVAFNGGIFYGNAFPGAAETMQSWAKLNGCSGNLVEFGTPLDLDTVLLGDESTRSRATCAMGAAELWTIPGGAHIPRLGSSWGEEVWSFLQAHPKP